MIFDFEAVNAKGATIVGELQAVDRKDAIRVLRDRGLIVTELADQVSSWQAPSKSSTPQDLLMSLHELATLLESGVSVSETITAQSKANYPQDLHEKYKTMAAKIRQGSSFSDALITAEFDVPAYFPQLVRAGELTGNLALSLREGVNQFEYDLRVREEFRSLLIYPTILVISGIAAVLLIFIFVVPKFAPLVSRSDDLPLLSVMVLSGGMWFNENTWLLVGMLIAVGGFIWYGIKSERIRGFLFELTFEMPVVGRWMRESESSMWCALMATLLSAKVDLLESLNLARDAMRSRKRRGQLTQIVGEIEAGEALADSLERAKVLTPTSYNLIRSGERTGKLSLMMRAVAQLYEETSRARMKRTMAIIEPVTILVIGGVIGVIILGVILAITSVNELVVS